ncbi:MAG: hypothetical protein K2X27_01150 [Candidatus Obscuribacterales bacterium]|nr:hypothetical protein [Candidatus Obscuribacterales bacterium]
MPEQQPQQSQSLHWHFPPVLQASQHLHLSPQQQFADLSAAFLPEQQPQQSQSLHWHFPPVLQASQHLHLSPQQQFADLSAAFLPEQQPQQSQSLHWHLPPVLQASQHLHLSPQQQFALLSTAPFFEQQLPFLLSGLLQQLEFCGLLDWQQEDDVESAGVDFCASELPASVFLGTEFLSALQPSSSIRPQSAKAEQMKLFM